MAPSSSPCPRSRREAGGWPTLDRWFPNQSLLLGAVAAYEVEQFDVGLQTLADAHHDRSAADSTPHCGTS